MKRIMAMLMASCMLVVGSFPLVACAATVDTADDTSNEMIKRFVDDAYAVVVDSEGNVIENLDVDITFSEVSSQRNAGTTYTMTARATKTDSDATDPKDGVTAEGTITWNDIFGTTNLLVSVSGRWIVGDETVSDPSVRYGARDTQNTLLASFEKVPILDEDYDFGYEPKNCTGYLFYLRTAAKIDATDNYIYLYVQTSAGT